MLKNIDINFKNLINYSSHLTPFKNNLVLIRYKSLGETSRFNVLKDKRLIKKRQIMTKKKVIK